ncbi:hypothetical protein EVG20_g11512 [Dentipellis fragilis]|uniref:Uncharacterized protein n=1 Tax=Dentipellis fragilis TaxID=205917 RepID=A0A4Y9XM88_9AGAM|nr:hypothetical protein EVG20_g11512 [Dentipellis fragilis]
MALALDKAVLVALFVECIMYVNKRLLWVLFSMLVLATGHIVLSFVRVIEGLIVRNKYLDSNPSAYFGVTSNRIFMVKSGIFIVQTLLGNNLALLCDMWQEIEDDNPSIACMIEVALACETGSIFLGPGRWIKIFHVLMLVTIVYCNVAIIWRIWTAGYFSASGGQLRHVLVVVVETGTLYTASLVTFLVVYLKPGIQRTVHCHRLNRSARARSLCLIILQIKYHQTNDAVHFVDSLDEARPATRWATFRIQKHDP